MTNKTTKSALLMSALALLLCIAMLTGTTFAWFTDEVTSGNNIIKSGNLDIELEYWNGADWVDVKGQSDILTNELWEPGVTEVAYLRVANAGSLALKYQLGINIINEIPGVNVAGDEFKLSDYIKFGVVELDSFALYASREAAIDDVVGAKKISAGYTKATSMAAGEELFLALVVWMPTTVGNGANHNGVKVPQINLGINVAATQYAAESDSWGSDYDDGAFIPVAPEAIPEEDTALKLNGSAESGVTVDVPASVVSGLDDAVTSLTVAASAPIVNANDKTVTFSTLDLLDQDGNKVDLSGATAKVTVTLPVGDAFADGEQVEVYHDGEFVTYATVSDGKISYEVSHFCEVEVKAAEEVVLDNTIDSVKEFMAFAAAVNAGNSYQGQTVILGADLDLAGVTWTPIGTSSNPFKGTFDGNGKVIKNLSVLMAGKSNVGLFGFTTEGEIKNVTVENAKIAGRLNVGVVAGTPYTSKYTNVTVKGHVEVDGMAYVGAVGGKNAYANWTDIVVNVDATSYVNANSVENGTAYRTYVGGVVGFNGEGGHTFKNITSNIAVIGSTCDIGGAFGIAHYGNKFENVTVTGTVTGAEGAYEIGGIAGVWHNENGTTVTFTNCKYAGNLSIVGASYNTNTTGKLIVDGEEVAASAKTLQAQLNAGKTDITLFCDINGDVIVTQKEGVNVVIDGDGYKYDGTVYIYGQARSNGAETLTIKNVNFASDDAKDFISSNSTDSDKRYAHNVTVENCTFTGDEDFGSVGIRLRQAYNINVVDCTATNLHSLLQANGCSSATIVVDGCKIVNCKNGVAFNNTKNAVITDCEIDAFGYGVRVDANGAYTLTATDNTISADVCVLFRNATGAYTATLNNNKLDADVHTILTTSGDYEEGKDSPAATGALNITVDGVQVVSTADELIAALEAKKDVVFANNIKIEPAKMSNAYGATGINVKYGQTIDGNGYTLNIKGAGGTWDSGINTTGGVIKNITVTGSFRGIFINHTSDYSEKVVLENVVIGGNGTVYTISCDQGLYQGIEATNCTFNGWTSFAKTAGEAKFVNCTFGEGSGYKYCRPYSNTEFVNCTFCEGYAVDTTRATVTFTDCTGLN